MSPRESLPKRFLHQLKKRWLTAAFFLGFITDLILLNRVDDLFDNLILLGYATLASISLPLFYVGIAQRIPGKIARFLVRFMPAIMQYSFGGLLSGMLIFYGRSGDWITSAPFLLLILAVIFGNELVSKRSDRLIYHLSVYFIGVFSYTVLVLPVLFGAMGDVMFFLSGLVALIVVIIVAQILYRIVPNFMSANTRRLVLTLGAIYASLNILYFTSVIPPIPLSLTSLEVVQSVIRLENGQYRIVSDAQPWWLNYTFIKPVIHPISGSVSCFSRVYAPARLSTNIFHRWEYKNAEGNWTEHARIGYFITGSNENGYRGYTTISNYQDGVWRCSIETQRGQVLGRFGFVIDTTGIASDPVTRIE